MAAWYKNIDLICSSLENPAWQVLDSAPNPLHVALNARVVEDRKGARGEGQVGHLQQNKIWSEKTITCVIVIDPGMRNAKKSVSESQAKKLALAVMMFRFFRNRNESSLKPWIWSHWMRSSCARLKKHIIYLYD